MAIKLPTCQWFKSFLLMPTCENVLGQETETQIVPNEQAIECCQGGKELYKCYTLLYEFT